MISGNEGQEEKKDKESVNPISYINSIITNLAYQKQQAKDLISQEKYIEAEKIFATALAEYDARVNDLKKIKYDMLFPCSHELDNVDELDATSQKYTEASGILLQSLRELVAQRKENTPIAKAQEHLLILEQERQLTLEEAEKQAQNVEQLTSKAEETSRQAAEAQAVFENLKTGNHEKKVDDSSDKTLNMQILGGFITALGVAAVAIAFAALNAAGLAMPGVLLAGFGVGVTLLGASIFSSKAKNIDDYTRNVYGYIGMAPA